MQINLVVSPSYAAHSRIKLLGKYKDSNKTYPVSRFPLIESSLLLPYQLFFQNKIQHKTLGRMFCARDKFRPFPISKICGSMGNFIIKMQIIKNKKAPRKTGTLWKYSKVLMLIQQ